MLVDFCLPGEDGSLVNAVNEWHRKSKPQICSDIGFHMATTGWNEQIFNEMPKVLEMGVNHLNILWLIKGLMVEDDEMYAPLEMCCHRQNNNGSR